jgi:hypothetical protein
MKYISSLVIAMMLSACGRDTIVEHNVEYTTVAPAIQSQIDNVVNQYNLDRLAQGQMPIVKGLTCTLYDVSSTTPSTIPASPPNNKGSFILNGNFNQQEASASDGLNILPSGLKNVYKQWYIVKCIGKIIITDSGYEAFRLSSDDGGMVYVDNVLLLNNDGLHGTSVVTASKLLLRGVHDFRLDYLQAGGNESLVLEDSQGVISGDKFYR